MLFAINASLDSECYVNFQYCKASSGFIKIVGEWEGKLGKGEFILKKAAKRREYTLFIC